MNFESYYCHCYPTSYEPFFLLHRHARSAPGGERETRTKKIRRSPGARHRSVILPYQSTRKKKQNLVKFKLHFNLRPHRKRSNKCSTFQREASPIVQVSATLGRERYNKAVLRFTRRFLLSGESFAVIRESQGRKLRRRGRYARPGFVPGYNVRRKHKLSSSLVIVQRRVGTGATAQLYNSSHPD